MRGQLTPPSGVFDFFLVSGGSFNPTGGVVHYIILDDGPILIGAPSTSSQTVQSTAVPTMQAPGTITRIDLTTTVAGTLGSGETGSASVRVNNSVETVVFNNIVKWTALISVFVTNAGLPLSLNKGDWFQIKITPPASWVIPPTGVSYVCRVYGTTP